jgi:hypothetical protein
MPAVLVIGALLLAGRVFLRHRRRWQQERQLRRDDAQRWEGEGGALRTNGEQSAH